MSEHITNKNCQNCLHEHCLFYGKNRTPVYVYPINCWDNAYKVIAKGIERNVGEPNV